MPYALLQAWGRPDITAKLHLVEIPCYFALLYWGIRAHGIEGAALAWTIRLSVEAGILVFVLRNVLAPRLWITMAAGTGVLILVTSVNTLALKIGLFIGILAIFACAIWRWTLDDLLRLRVLTLIKAMPVLNRANA